MKISFTVLAFLFFFLPAASFAQSVFDTPAKQAILIDANTGTVLFEKEGAARMPTSSMSKVMTMYMVFEAIDRGHLSLNDEFTISEKAWKMGGSRMFIEVGKTVKVEDLIRGVVIQSGNDATVALAEGIAGSEEAFVELMNLRAKEIGLQDSNFRNASGWPDSDHYSTPRDLAILAHRIKEDFPKHFHYFAEKEFTYNKITQPNRDPLLGRLPGADGLKTGHTEAAGYGLIGTAERNGRRLIMVVNGLSSEKERADESVRIMEWGFNNFESKKIVSAGAEIEEVQVWLGESELVPMVAEKDFTAVLPKLGSNRAEISLRYASPLKAPLKKGESIGTLKISIPGQSPAEINLVAGKDIPMKGFFGRAKARLEYLVTGNI